MANIDDNKYKIETLNANSTFYDWINHYNQNVVGKLNSIVVYDGISGDGIDFTLGTTASDDPSGGESTGTDLPAGIFRATLSKTIPAHLGVTFEGDVTVQGSLNFDQTPIRGSLIERTGFRVYGPTAGFTFGSVVRSTTGGIKLARADGQHFAESVGVVCGVTNDYIEVCTSGVIQGDFSEVLNQNGPNGITLESGCVYFLDSGLSGGITANETRVAGQVSKPMIVGITYENPINGRSTSTATVVNYRGQYLSTGVTAGDPGFTANDNIALVSLQGASPDGVNHQLDVGTVAGYNPGWAGAGMPFPVYGSGWFKVQTEEGRNYSVGVVTHQYDMGGQYHIDVVGSGFIDQYTPQSVSDGEYGLLYIHPDGSLKGTLPGNDTAFPFMFVWNQGGDKKAYVLNQRSSGNSVPLSGGGGLRSFVVDNSLSGITYGQAFQDNLLINGSFSVWQRGPGSFAATGDYYFADRWLQIDGVSGGGGTSTYNISKQAFSSTQTDVEGQPTNYTRTNHVVTGVTGGDYIHIVNRMEDNRFLNGEPVTLSFYAKCGITGATMGFVTRQYDGSSTHVANYGGETGSRIAIGTQWHKYAVSFNIPNQTTYSSNGYLDVGFNTTHIGSDLDLAQVKLERGNIPTILEPIVDEYKELEKCSRYYQRSYNISQTTGVATMSGNDPRTSAVDVFVTPLQI